MVSVIFGMDLRTHLVCIRHTAHATALAYIFLGFAIFVVGVWIRLNPENKFNAAIAPAFNYFFTGSYILIAISAIVISIGIVGTTGIAQKQYNLVTYFLISLMLVLLCLVIASVWGVLSRESLMESVKKNLRVAVKTYSGEETSRLYLDSLMFNVSLSVRGERGSFSPSPFPSSPYPFPFSLFLLPFSLYLSCSPFPPS